MIQELHVVHTMYLLYYSYKWGLYTPPPIPYGLHGLHGLFAFPWTFVDFLWTCYGLFFFGETYCKMRNLVHRKSTEIPQKVHAKSTKSSQFFQKSMDFLLKSPQVHGKSMDKASMDVPWTSTALHTIHGSPWTSCFVGAAVGNLLECGGY